MELIWLLAIACWITFFVAAWNSDEHQGLIARVVAGAAAVLQLVLTAAILYDVRHRPGAIATYAYAAATFAITARYLSRRRAPAIIVALALFACFTFTDNPLSRYNVCFDEDLPGATSRFREFTLRSCANPDDKSNARVAADYALLRFDRSEDPPLLIVTSNAIDCALDACFSPPSRTYRLAMVEGAIEVVER